ncbi:MAG: hypothetical protein SGARI_007932, partial [Bacillariaceae sp.]
MQSEKRPAHGSLSVGNRGFARNCGATNPPSEASSEWWSAQNLLDDICYTKKWLREECGDRAILATTADEVRQAHASSQTAIMLDVQNTDFLGKDLDQLNKYYELGLRRVQLTYNFQNLC